MLLDDDDDDVVPSPPFASQGDSQLSGTLLVADEPEDVAGPPQTSQGSETVLVAADARSICDDDLSLSVMQLEDEDDLTSFGGADDDGPGDDDDDDQVESDDIWVDSYSWRQPRASTSPCKRVRYDHDDDVRSEWHPRRRLGFDALAAPKPRARATRGPYRCSKCGKPKKGHICVGGS